MSPQQQKSGKLMLTQAAAIPGRDFRALCQGRKKIADSALRPGWQLEDGTDRNRHREEGPVTPGTARSANLTLDSLGSSVLPGSDRDGAAYGRSSAPPIRGKSSRQSDA